MRFAKAMDADSTDTQLVADGTTVQKSRGDLRYETIQSRATMLVSGRALRRCMRGRRTSFWRLCVGRQGARPGYYKLRRDAELRAMGARCDDAHRGSCCWVT